MKNCCLYYGRGSLALTVVLVFIMAAVDFAGMTDTRDGADQLHVKKMSK